MRWAIIGLLVLVAGCKKSESPEAMRDQATTSADKSGPNVGLTQTPGVSLSYRYGFRLPIEKLAAVQEAHASQCEQLTPAKCRVTGMSYQAGRNRSITASLELKLAPEIARQFGKQGISTVVGQGGMLSYANIDSEESGAVVAAVDSNTAALTAERQDIAAQLDKPGLSPAERTQLQARLATLRDTQRASTDVRNDAALKLASTPMTFNYESGDVDPGFSDGPITGAIKDGWTNIVDGFAIMLLFAITLAPWIAAFVLILWLWRTLGARLGLRRKDSED